MRSLDSMVSLECANVSLSPVSESTFPEESLLSAERDPEVVVVDVDGNEAYFLVQIYSGGRGAAVAAVAIIAIVAVRLDLTTDAGRQIPSGIGGARRISSTITMQNIRE